MRQTKAKRLYYLLFVFFLSKNDNNKKCSHNFTSVYLFTPLLTLLLYPPIAKMISESETKKKQTKIYQIKYAYASEY